MFTVLYPVGASQATGYGSRIRVQSTNGFNIGDEIQARLLFAGSSSRFLATARSPVAGSSRLCDLFWGWDDVGGTPSPIPLAGPDAAYSNLRASVGTYVDGQPVDLVLEYRDSTPATIDGPTTFPNQFVLDPISQGPWLTLSRLFDQATNNFDTLLAAINALSPSGATFDGTHAGLSGSGSFAVTPGQSALVVLGAVPPAWGQTFESPRRLIPAVGSIQFCLGTDVADSQLVHYDRQLVSRPIPFADTLRYSFKPTISAAITLFS